MIKEEISQYIIDQKIPISIIWEDNKEYYLLCCIENNRTIGKSLFDTNLYTFPNWNQVHYKFVFEYRDHPQKNNNIFENYTDKCLSEFFFWFELNKYRCKNIEYYEKQI